MYKCSLTRIEWRKSLGFLPRLSIRALLNIMLVLIGTVMEYKPKTIAEWFLHRAAEDGESLTQMKLQKLVYIAHGWSLGLYNEPLIDSTIEAWKWGPVIRPLYRAYVDFGSNPITRKPEEKPRLDGRTEHLLEQIWKVYRRYTAVELSGMTHKPGTPWDTAYVEGEKTPISNDVIAEHYRQLAEK